MAPKPKDKKEHPDKKDYWQNELRSLGIEPRRQNELNDEEELRALSERALEQSITGLQNGI